MAIDLNKQYGPFSLKIWLLIGVGGVGIGLFVASKQNSGKGATSDKGLAVPPQVIFNRVVIGLEHVPDTTKVVAPIKPPVPNPIMPSNPAAKPTIPVVKPPIAPEPIIKPIIPAPAYTAVAPTIWQSFISGTPVTAATVAEANRQGALAPKPLYSGVDPLSGNAFF